MKLTFATNQGPVHATPVEMLQYIINGSYDMTNQTNTIPEKIFKKQRKILSSQKSHMIMYHTQLHVIKLIQVHKITSYLNKQYRFINDILASWLDTYLTTSLHNITQIKQNSWIIKHFDLRILQETNMTGLYFNDTIHQEIISCPRRSYVKYIKSSKPHYTRNELVQYGLNLGVIKERDAFDALDFAQVCSQVSKTEIPGQVIIEHHRHILARQCQYLVKNFSFYLSSLMNHHLRKHTPMHKQLGQHIEALVTCIHEAPPFPHDTFVYRFIHDDAHLKHLQVGDIHQDHGFTSASRNPFCEKDSEFGFVLVKIKLPGNVPGIGLMIETLSYFPHEEEIILPPSIQLQLVAVHDDVKYYHTLNILESIVVKRYEFVIIPTKLSPPTPLPLATKPLPINNITLTGRTVRQKIESFLKHSPRQFTFNNVDFTCFPFDSTKSYQQLYSAAIPYGLVIFNINNHGKIELSIEIKPSVIAINYIHRFQNNDDPAFTDENIVTIGKMFAHLFDIPEIHVYCDYCSSWSLDKTRTQQIGCSTHLMLSNYNINVDFYHYIHLKRPRFTTGANLFFYSILESMMEFSIDDPKVQPMKQLMQSFHKTTTLEFYTYLATQEPMTLDTFIKWSETILNSDENPFLQPKYVFFL